MDYKKSERINIANRLTIKSEKPFDGFQSLSFSSCSSSRSSISDSLVINKTMERWLEKNKISLSSLNELQGIITSNQLLITEQKDLELNVIKNKFKAKLKELYNYIDFL